MRKEEGKDVSEEGGRKKCSRGRGRKRLLLVRIFISLLKGKDEANESAGKHVAEEGAGKD